MGFDDICLEIIEKISAGEAAHIDTYCAKYPEHAQALRSKFDVYKFIKANFDDSLKVQQLGEYAILQELGRGGMGIAYLAVQPSLSRLVVIKVLPPGFARDKAVLKNFQTEATIIAKFSHPNIIPVFSFGEASGVYYIAMGYVPGVSLRGALEIIKKAAGAGKVTASAIRELLQIAAIKESPHKSITLKRHESFWNASYYHFVAKIVSEISEAISYAHQNGIFHGDIKPSNILLDHELLPMVVDFGLSQDTRKLATSKSREFAGTLAYAAPEQIKNNTINEKTDIWALGVTLYELLTLHKPFIDQNIEKTVNKILKGDPPHPRLYAKTIPIELEAIALKCLAKDPCARYATIAELATDLRNYMEMKPIKAKPVGPLGIFSKIVKRHPILSTVFIILLGAGLFFSSASYRAGMYKHIDKEAYLSLNRQLQEASSLQVNSNFREAKDLYQKILDKAKALPLTEKIREQALLGLGGTCYGLEQKEEAENYYSQCLGMNQNNVEALNGLAALYGFMFRDYDRALTYYGRMLSLNPSDIAAIRDYADTLIILTRIEDALRFLADKCKDKGIAGHQFTKLQIQHAIHDVIFHPKLYEKKGLSIKTYDDIKVLMRSCGFEDIYTNKFVAQFRKNSPWFANDAPLQDVRIQAQKKLYEDYFGTRPNANETVADGLHDNIPTQLAAATKLSLAGSHADAIVIYTQIIGSYPSMWDMYIRRGIEYGMQKDYDNAINDFNRAIEILPSSDQAYLNRATTYLYKGMLDNALADYNKTIELNPQSPLPYLGRGNVLYRKGILDKAIADFNKAIELDKNNPEAYANRAIMFYDKKDYVKAWADVREAQRLTGNVNPGFIEALRKASKE